MKRFWLLSLAILLISSTNVPSWSYSTDLPAEGAASKSPFLAEKFLYAISIFGFDGVAKAEFSFQEDENGRFVALLDARTLGLAAKLSGNRRQTYRTLMEYGPEGRFRPLRFEQSTNKKVVGGAKARVKRYDFDYERMRVRYVRIKNGKEGKPVFLAMKEGSPAVDSLTGFVNFRMGFYGRPTPGNPLLLETFVRGGNSQIRVEAIFPADARQKEFFRGCPDLNRVVLDPEIFDTGGGDVFVCLDKEGRPLRGAVENVLGLGDVLGRLLPSDADR